ncbi:hypothetical protein [Tepidibacillus marianensis]|uniref:hypothetical protein n=1 Tax=Tepidibacillus marianensis TaxID=3131995 RepID=UPI0030CC2651
MKKQFFINENPVSRVSFQWTVWSEKGDDDNWLETDDLTPRKLLNRMNNSVRYEDFRIASIGFESFDYPDFAVEFKDDGAHLYVDGLTDEAIRAADQEYRDWEAEYEANRAKELDAANIKDRLPSAVGLTEDVTLLESVLNSEPDTEDKLAAAIAAELPGMDAERVDALTKAFLAFRPDIDAEQVHQILNNFKRMADAVAEIAQVFIEAIRPVVQAIAKIFDHWFDNMLRATAPNLRWWHLYKHAKKARVRKKYRRLLMDNLLATVQAAGAI